MTALITQAHSQSSPRDPSRIATRRRKNDLEHQIQVAVFDWRAHALPQWPDLALLHAVPNGAKLPFKKIQRHGKMIRVSREAVRLKREGLTPGMTDIAWPVPRGRFHGLYIEAKTPTGTVNRDQARIQALLAAQGHQVLVLRDPADIIASICAYWALGPFRA